MDLNQQKEEFSNAYIRAIAAVAGLVCYKPTPDVESVDWGFAALGAQGTTRSPRLEIQLKCSATAQMGATVITHQLKVKNYNDLCAVNYLVPRILVVVMVPHKLDDWVSQNESERILRRCGYWLSLRGKEPTTNETTVSVALPRDQLFSVAAVSTMMKAIANRGFP